MRRCRCNKLIAFAANIRCWSAGIDANVIVMGIRSFP